jgi:uncharacterized protein
MKSMGHLCPTCRKPVKEGEKHFPFCSERCRWIDLGHWLDEDYRIPVSGPGAVSDEELEGEEPATLPQSDDEGDGEGEDEGAAPRPGGGA